MIYGEFVRRSEVPDLRGSRVESHLQGRDCYEPEGEEVGDYYEIRDGEKEVALSRRAIANACFYGGIVWTVIILTIWLWFDR